VSLLEDSPSRNQILSLEIWFSVLWGTSSGQHNPKSHTFTYARMGWWFIQQDLCMHLQRKINSAYFNSCKCL